MNADELLEYYTAKIDAAICEGATRTAQHLLDHGATVDDLPRLMNPIVQRLAQWRAHAVVKLQANTARMRENELRIQAIEAYIARLESQAMVH